MSLGAQDLENVFEEVLAIMLKEISLVLIRFCFVFFSCVLSSARDSQHFVNVLSYFLCSLKEFSEEINPRYIATSLQSIGEAGFTQKLQ